MWFGEFLFVFPVWGFPLFFVFFLDLKKKKNKTLLLVFVLLLVRMLKR